MARYLIDQGYRVIRESRIVGSTGREILSGTEGSIPANISIDIVDIFARANMSLPSWKKPCGGVDRRTGCNLGYPTRSLHHWLERQAFPCSKTSALCNSIGGCACRAVLRKDNHPFLLVGRDGGGRNVSTSRSADVNPSLSAWRQPLRQGSGAPRVHPCRTMDRPRDGEVEGDVDVGSLDVSGLLSIRGKLTVGEGRIVGRAEVDGPTEVARSLYLQGIHHFDVCRDRRRAPGEGR